MIYIIRAAGTDLFKVGYTSRHPEARLKELQTGCPHPIKVVHIMEGSLEEEGRLHEILGAYRVSGEWFKLNYERLFSVVVNEAFSEERIKPFGDERVNQANHIKVFLEDHFLASKKKPKKIEHGVLAKDLLTFYTEFCKVHGVAAIGDKYFFNRMKRYPFGFATISGNKYYSLRLKEDSFLNHDDIRTDYFELRAEENNK